MSFTKANLLVTILITSSYALTGCSESPKANNPTKGTPVASKEADEHDHDAEHEHGEWWCDEHGVPEAICALCDSKLAAEFQKKGDWCEKHNRPDSQCFICHPELEAKFAAQYEAKYGKKPPKPHVDADDHEHDHDKKS